MPHVRVRLRSLLVTGLLVGCAAGSAQAGTVTVIAAIKSQDKVVKGSAAYKALQHFQANTPAEARKVLVEFKALQRKVEHAATVVSKASATGTRQKLGQKDWVTGVRDVARGIGQLDIGLQDIINGKTAVGKTELKKGTRTMAIGNAVGTKGDKLLGIPLNY